MASSKGELSGAKLTVHRQSTVCGSEVYSYARFPSDSSHALPILVLLHGYPQTSFMWRKLIKFLPEDYPLFVPDLPGYGRSTPSKTDHSKRAIGRAILEALHAILASTSSPADPVSVILCGHDRGARICHRLAVDFNNPSNPDLDPSYVKLLSGFKLDGTICLDTVPDVLQWETFGTAKHSVSTFHWPLLANVEVAYPMITAYGGDNWCRDMLVRWAGKEHGPKCLEEDGAFEVYCQSFRNPDVVRATCEDYAAGARVDLERQQQDQKEGRKLGGRLLLVFSDEYLGARYDVCKVWKDWIDADCELTPVGVGNGVGHFVAEETPEKVAAAVKKFLNV